MRVSRWLESGIGLEGSLKLVNPRRIAPFGTARTLRGE